MQTLQEQIETTQTVLLENILDSVEYIESETNSPITVGELYSLCEDTINFIIEEESRFLLSEAKQKPASASGPGSLQKGPSSEPWKNKKLVKGAKKVKFEKLRAAKGKKALEEAATEQDLYEATDAMIEALIAEGFLDAAQKVGDFASLVPGVGRYVGLANAGVSALRGLMAKPGERGQHFAAAAQRALLPGGAVTGGLAARGIGKLAPGLAGGIRNIPGFGGFGGVRTGGADASTAGSAGAPSTTSTTPPGGSIAGGATPGSGTATTVPVTGGAGRPGSRPTRGFTERLPGLARLAGMKLRGLGGQLRTQMGAAGSGLSQVAGQFMRGLQSTGGKPFAGPKPPVPAPAGGMAGSGMGSMGARIPALTEGTLPNYIHVGIGARFGKNPVPSSDELNVISQILSEANKKKN